MADGRSYGFESFECAPGLRLEAHERLSRHQFEGLGQRLDRIEAAMERLERRLWLAVYGVVGGVLAQAFLSVLDVGP